MRGPSAAPLLPFCRDKGGLLASSLDHHRNFPFLQEGELLGSALCGGSKGVSLHLGR